MKNRKARLSAHSMTGGAALLSLGLASVFVLGPAAEIVGLAFVQLIGMIFVFGILFGYLVPVAVVVVALSFFGVALYKAIKWFATKRPSRDPPRTRVPVRCEADEDELQAALRDLQAHF